MASTTTFSNSAAPPESVIGVASTNVENFISADQIPAFVERVHFTGVERTRDDIFSRLCTRAFGVRSFQDLVLSVHELEQELRRIGVAKQCSVFVDTSDAGSGGIQNAAASSPSPHGYDITVKLHEPNRIVGGVHTTVGNAEGGVHMQGQLPNIFRRGEKLSADIGYGSRTKFDFHLSLIKPIIFSKTLDITTSLFRRQLLFEDAFKLKAQEHGISVSLNRVLNERLTQKLTLETAWRQVMSTGLTTPLSLRRYAGHFMKHSAQCELTYDERDHHLLPSQGVFANLTSELAAGSTAYWKNDAHLQINAPLPFYNCSLQASLMGGFLKGFNSQRLKPLNIIDKFFLGGPLILRGFLPFHAGPHADECALGGTLYYAFGLHAYSRVPFFNEDSKFSQHIKLHGFFNAGNVANIGGLESTPVSLDGAGMLSSTIPPTRSLQQLFNRSSIRASYGFGLVVSLGNVVRLEINYVVPFAAGVNDIISTKKCQFAFGITYS